MEFTSVNKLFEESFKKNWDRPAISNYQGVTLHYRDVARRIEKLHIMFEECGLQKGDKVAICSRNQANWAVSFLSALTYGAVPVPLLHEFKPGNIHHLVNHSEAKILFVDDVVWEGLTESEMPLLHAVIQVNTFKLLYSTDEKITSAREHLNELFGRKYPEAFVPEAIWSNIVFARGVLPLLDNTKSVVSMLPCAHMYGLMFEVLYELSVGAHVHFLSRVPSPKIIMQALAEVKPYVVIAVPLVIEKIYKSKVKPVLEKEGIRFLMKLPVLNQVVMNKIRTELVNAFGGQFEEVIIGGAAFNKEVEAFFKQIGFPFTVGYGMTECAPIITYDDWKVEKLYSCGKIAPNLEIKIESADPQNVPGEVLVRGANVFLGYYKNEEATSAVFTKDGWFRTGDMGVIDADGCLFLKGRSKCMILGPSGQNIYPEEIETVLNSQPYVVDSLVIEDNGGLTALIYPDFRMGETDGMDQQGMVNHFEKALPDINKELPNYAKLKKIEVMSEDFERTPKKSIKRYLYQRS